MLRQRPSRIIQCCRESGTVNRTVYPTREHARKDVARYIEFRYNTQRLHSALGYQTPQEVYDEYLNRQSAA
ncbi:MAG: integrase core domain-containing protein [Pseudonocardiaceae bacterium]